PRSLPELRARFAPCRYTIGTHRRRWRSSSVSELDPVDVTHRTVRFTEKPSDSETDELSGSSLERRKPTEREGLPPSYRMRADAHYVDQLTSRSADLPVRWVPIDEFEGGARQDAEDLAPLVQSIAEHGVVHPLLVRREGEQYRLIAGRKRLAAARIAALSRVPCLIHHVEDAQAEALARADNLRLESDRVPRVGFSPSVASVIGNVSEAVASIGSAAMLLAGHGSPMARRVALDLVKAEAWRAAWQLRATTILEQLYAWRHKPTLLISVLERVREGFASESRLTGVGLKLNVLDSNAFADLDEDAAICGVTGAVIAAAALVAEV